MELILFYRDPGIQKACGSGETKDTSDEKNLFMPVFCITLCVILSCKKENDSPFNPVGYWHGSAYFYHVAILNNADGTARIYFRIQGTDTAHAGTIADGTYTFSGNSFRAQGISNGTDTFFLETFSLSADEMTGHLYNSFTPDIVDFKLRKQ